LTCLPPCHPRGARVGPGPLAFTGCRGHRPAGPARLETGRAKAPLAPQGRLQRQIKYVNAIKLRSGRCPGARRRSATSAPTAASTAKLGMSLSDLSDALKRGSPAASAAGPAKGLSERAGDRAGAARSAASGRHYDHQGTSPAPRTRPSADSPRSAGCVQRIRQGRQALGRAIGSWNLQSAGEADALGRGDLFSADALSLRKIHFGRGGRRRRDKRSQHSYPRATPLSSLCNH
jgi:hypothetical protein